MAMKKKFLGLAMAAAIALPASSAYAANNTLTGNVNDTLTQDVKVSGSVKNSQGIAPAGKIEVELPTTMSFTVDQSGTFQGVNYQVKNNSAVGISVAVSDFRETNKDPDNGIVLTPHSENMSTLPRNNVKLALVGNEGHVDLSDTTAIKQKPVILKVDPNASTGTIQLLGDAGKDTGSTNQSKPVETKGVDEEFTLVFEIKKQ